MTMSVADFDRSNPLFERSVVSFEVVTTPSSTNNNNATSSTNGNNNGKCNCNFTVRILEGRRSATSSGGGDGERVIRFEMSNECNLVGDSLPTHQQHQCTPSRRATPIIHAPLMTVDRGGGQGHHSNMMQGGPKHHHHQSPQTRLQPQQKSLNLPIELYELEVGESDFAALRRDQALLVDFNSFSDSLISLLQCCELGSEDENGGGCSSNHQQTFQNTSNQYGQQQQPYDESASGGWNGNGQVGGVSRQSAMGQQQHQWGSSNNSNTWSTPSHHQGQGGGMNYHGQRMMSSPFANMNCSTSMPVSTYACRLEVDASSNGSNSMQQWRQNSAQQPNNNNSMRHARFSIVESNQFRELTHLALNLNVGTDKSVRCYLSSRYVCCFVCDVCHLCFRRWHLTPLSLSLPCTLRQQTWPDYAPK